jgi:hypothetical protein
MPVQDEGLPAGYGSDTSAAKASAGAAAAGGAPSVLQLAGESDQRPTPPEAYMQVNQGCLLRLHLNSCSD